MRSYTVAQSGVEFTGEPRLASNSWQSFCLSISSARISDMNYHKPFSLQFQGGPRQTSRDPEREFSTHTPHFSSYIVHTANKFFL